MSSKSIFKVWFKYEHKDEEATSTQYIEAYDKTSAKDIWLRCYKEEEDTLINTLFVIKQEKVMAAKILKDFRKGMGELSWMRVKNVSEIDIEFYRNFPNTKLQTINTFP